MAPVMPAATALWNALSMGLMASMARRQGVTGVVPSLQSSPCRPTFSSEMPMWLWASMMPG